MNSSVRRRFRFYEFFAGGGMARLGLGPSWECLFANEWCLSKAASYRAFFGSDPEPLVEDVALVKPQQLPGKADMAWASFPCQDLSLAGQGAGLDGERSGTFKPFWALISALNTEGRAPTLVVLENVVGALSSRGGRDFAYLMECLAREGYAGGALVMDAADFVPQSRPRLFVVGIRRTAFRAQGLTACGPVSRWHPAPLRKAFEALPDWLVDWWLWWSLPDPPPRRIDLADVLEENPPATLWHSPAETKKLLSLMDPVHLERIRKAQSLGTRVVGTLYRRSRPDPETGHRRQRAEVRFDGVAGCLRTPAGGSSRQIVVIVEGRKVRTRLLSAREAARLMGVPDAYPIPANYNEAYHLFGDGLAVPVVSWLSTHLLEPLLLANAEVAAA